MERRHRPHPFDLVNMAARLRKRFAEECLGRSVTEQQQSLGLRQSDMATSDLSAGFPIGGTHL